MGINFPTAPTVNQLHPVPAVAGVPQYKWDGTAWIAGSGVHAAADVASTPVGNVAATNVQAAIAELDNEKVAKAGDRMTGALRVHATASFAATPYPSSISAQHVSTDYALYLNSHINAAGVQVAQGAGYTGQINIDPGNGNIVFRSSDSSVLAGAETTQVVTATLTRSGVFYPSTIQITGPTADGYSALFLANAGGNQAGLGLVGGALNFNSNNGEGFSWSQSGNGRMTLNKYGGLVIQTPTTSTQIPLFVWGAYTNYAQDNRAMSANSGSFIGWAVNTTQYGQCGVHNGSTYYSFFGSTTAYIASGTWSISDGRLKNMTRELDPTTALAAVNSLTVKEFTPVNPEACEMFHGSREVANETLYGWSAQEVEAVIPIAVRDVLVPKVDRNMRAAMKRIPIPDLDSKEAEELGEEEISVKAINDRYMLTTLWTAVQRLSQQNTDMLNQIEALKAQSA